MSECYCQEINKEDVNLDTSIHICCGGHIGNHVEATNQTKQKKPKKVKSK